MKPHIPRRLLFDLTLSLIRGERRSVLQDSTRMIAALPPALIRGHEHVPPAGPFTIVANHYQRRDLWVGWGGALLTHAVGRPVHWMVLRELVLDGREVPFSRLAFGAVARAYGFIRVPAGIRDASGQAAAIRATLRLLEAGEVAGFFPEGEHGHSGALSTALPGAARLAGLLSRAAPLLPAAVWEEGEGLCVAFGAPLPAQPSGEVLMASIARLLPRHLRGQFD